MSHHATYFVFSSVGPVHPYRRETIPRLTRASFYGTIGDIYGRYVDREKISVFIMLTT
jgi:hypothetical protein